MAKITNKLMCLSLLVMVVSIFESSAQSLYIGDGGQFYLSSTTSSSFTAGGTPVTQHANGSFLVEAGSTWLAATEYVNNKLTVLGAGTTTTNIGDGIQSSVTVTTQADDEIVTQYNSSAPTGDLDPALVGLGYDISDVEFWTVTKTSGSSTDIQVDNLTEAAGALYNGAASSGSLLVLRYNTATSQWEDYSSSPGFGDFALASITSLLLVDIDAFLQGPYDSGSGLMNDDLRVAAVIPTATPYSDGATVNATVFDATGNDAIVDWVFVELRDKNDITSVLASSSALLHRDGDVVDLDGVSSLGIAISTDNYYVSVSHRNHLAIASNAVVSLSTTTSTVDLTQVANVQGTTNAVVDLTGGIYGMFAGNVLTGNSVDITGVSNVLSEQGSAAYTAANVLLSSDVSITGVSLLLTNQGRVVQF